MLAAGAVGLGVSEGLGAAKGAGRGFGVALPGSAVGVGFAFPEGLALPDGLGLGEVLGWSAALPGCGWPATMRNRSWAVRLTESTRLEAFLPGISTMMLRLPCVETSASETPLPFTRESTMPAACLSLVWVIVLPALLDRGQGDPGAALEVEPQARLPVPAEGRQPVEDDDRQPEDQQRASRTWGLLRHGVGSPQSSVRVGPVVSVGSSGSSASWDPSGPASRGPRHVVRRPGAPP